MKPVCSYREKVRNLLRGGYETVVVNGRIIPIKEYVESLTKDGPDVVLRFGKDLGYGCVAIDTFPEGKELVRARAEIRTIPFGTGRLVVW